MRSMLVVALMALTGCPAPQEDRTVFLRNNSDQRFSLTLISPENPRGCTREFGPADMIAYAIHTRDFRIRIAGLRGASSMISNRVDLLAILDHDGGNVVDIFSDRIFRPLTLVQHNNQRKRPL